MDNGDEITILKVSNGFVVRPTMSYARDPHSLFDGRKMMVFADIASLSDWMQVNFNLTGETLV